MRYTTDCCGSKSGIAISPKSWPVLKLALCCIFLVLPLHATLVLNENEKKKHEAEEIVSPRYWDHFYKKKDRQYLNGIWKLKWVENRLTEDFIKNRKKEVNFYSTKEEEREIYNENNARNRCLLNRKKAVGVLDHLDEGVYAPYHETIVTYRNEIEEK